MDSPGWVNHDGKTCVELRNSGNPQDTCDHKMHHGLSAFTACCHCHETETGLRGGHLTPTTFIYIVRPTVVGQEVHGFPWPRTAERYTLNKGCTLSQTSFVFNGE